MTPISNRQQIIRHYLIVVVTLLLLPGMWLSACGGNEITPTPPIPPATPIVLSADSLPGYNPLGASPGAIAEYHLEVKLDLIGAAAQVVQFVDVTNPGPDTWDRIVFQLPAHMSEDTFVLSGISLFDGLETSAARYLVENGYITIMIERGVPPNGGVGVSMIYGLNGVETYPDSRRPYGDIGLSDEDIIQFVNWYPALVPYRPGRGWYLWEPTAAGDAIVTEVADYTLIVTAPNEDVVVVSGGPRSREGNQWRFEVQNARSIVFAASEKYEVLSQMVGQTTVFSYYLPIHELGGQVVLQEAVQALTLFNERFGPYPYNTLVIAENAYLHSATGAGIILHTYKGYTNYTGQPDTLLVALIPQTLSQMWWGGVVGTDAIQEPWITGSLTMYSEFLYYERYYPHLIDWFWESRVAYWEPEGPLEQTAYDLGDSSAIQRNIMRRGALFWQAVRTQIGDRAFFGFLSDYYVGGAYHLTNGDDVFAALERHVSPGELQQVVSQYFDVRAVPTPVATERRDVTPTPPLIYVVASDDTLLSIALKFGTDVDTLKRVNNLDSDILTIGQRLVIP